MGQAVGRPFAQNVQGTLLYDVRDTGQDDDLTYVLDHVDDLDRVYVLEQGEVRAIAAV